ncbi:hypothetical protein [Dictyobacter formicarum]|uniref:Uncharacterized protein n=1 Tax=Dictyobacter formicarum TaxID=2778368 RepID=A0ABQ3VQX6_9CHLR|nr:hypothetical protein [Dictyobacter formicarum]GHO88228.1 hypothetical protein KSZ_62340 [Dictyobacter formicarum]
MGKNTKKYKYLEIGLEWESWVLAQIEQDAADHQMSDQLAKLAALRLTEYYRLVQRGIIVSGLAMSAGSAPAYAPQRMEQQPAPEPVSERAPRPSRERRSPRVKDAEPPEELSEIEIIEESESAGDNADLAIDFFLQDDDDEGEDEDE